MDDLPQNELPEGVENFLIEGISNDLVYVVLWLSISLVATCLYTFRRRQPDGHIHPDSENDVTAVRETLEPAGTDGQEQGRERQRRLGDVTCPICLGPFAYAVETNCGHSFCCTCLMTYWRMGRWLGAVACPACRQQVTLLLTAFTPEELAVDAQDEEKARLLRDIRDYNRRFSGEPRSIMEHLRDFPTLLRHGLGALFTLDGMLIMFRLRILVCFLLVLIYFLSPLDLIPEAVLGIVGFVDDLLIIFILAVYISVLYRAVVANALGDE